MEYMHDLIFEQFFKWGYRFVYRVGVGWKLLHRRFEQLLVERKIWDRYIL